MNALDAAVVAGEINATIATLNKLRGALERFAPDYAKPGGRDLKDAVFVADILCRSYTCVETVFLRISRAFDNHLDPEGWHKDLLRKMRLEIPGVRPAVISEGTFSWLDELRRFRHFQRYYYDLELDWDRLEPLAASYVERIPVLERELRAYAAFCADAARAMGPDEAPPA